MFGMGPKQGIHQDLRGQKDLLAGPVVNHLDEVCTLCDVTDHNCVL